MMVVHTKEGVVQLAPGRGTLYKALLDASVPIAAPCGGRCFCGKCRVRVTGAPAPTPPETAMLKADEIARGVRLACAVEAADGLEVWMEAGEDAAAIMTAGDTAAFTVGPSIQVHALAMPAPSLQDARDDFTRLQEAIGSPLRAPLALVAQLPVLLRDTGFALDAAVMHGPEGVSLAFVTPRGGPVLGAAVDIGTTTLAAYLFDMRDGRMLGVESALNPQRAFGADVITRSDYAGQGDGLSQLAASVRGGLSDMLKALCKRAGASVCDIAHIVLAGNTVMMHLAAGLPPMGIAVSPFVPARVSGFEVSGAELQLPCTNARVTFMPSVAGYVGADTVAGVLASGMDQPGGNALLIDIGTNGEMVLRAGDRLLCCSTAAGPAFEGAHIRCGSGGVAGAISRVKLGDRPACEVIGGGDAQSICGSGLVDAVAEMLRVGLMDEMGRIDAACAGPLTDLITTVDAKPALTLCGGVFLCQRDIREVQLAKGAIAAGIEVLLSEAGLAAEDLSVIYLAGGFGNYIDISSACAIGLLPAKCAPRVKPIGNAAGAGARMALLSQEVLARCEEVRRRMTYLELSARPDFQDLFVEKMMFEP